jgi:hypothetical protein
MKAQLVAGAAGVALAFSGGAAVSQAATGPPVAGSAISNAILPPRSTVVCEPDYYRDAPPGRYLCMYGYHRLQLTLDSLGSARIMGLTDWTTWSKHNARAAGRMIGDHSAGPVNVHLYGRSRTTILLDFTGQAPARFYYFTRLYLSGPDVTTHVWRWVIAKRSWQPVPSTP